MVRRPAVLRGLRRFRSRRILFRTLAVLIVLLGLSLVFLLWAALFDDPNAPAGAGVEDEAVGPDGKIPFRPRRPAASSASTEAPRETDAVKQPWSSGGGVWFRPTPAAERLGNASWSDDLLLSSGNARIALPFGPDEATGVFAARAPRLFSAVADWQSYERALSTRGAAQDEHDAAAEDVQAQPPHAAAAARVVPVKHVEVRLLRQRTSRQAWAALTDPAVPPIVALLPRESAALVSADDLLVEDAVSRGGMVPLVAAVYPRGDDAAPTSAGVVSIDSHARAAAAALAAHGNANAGEGAAPLRRGLIELSSVARSTTSASASTVPAATRAQWRTGGESTAALDFTLDLAPPARSRGEQDETQTTALEATFCSARIRRVYGISPDLYGAADGDSIPLNLSSEVTLMVGGGASGLPGHGSPPLRGVVPLLYVELSPSSAEAAVAARRTVGVFWLHPGPFSLSTFAAGPPRGSEGGGHQAPSQPCVRLRGTGGATRLYLLPGPTAADVLRQYYTLTGFPTLPPRFLLGYHHGLRGAAATFEKAAEHLSEDFRQARVPLDSVWVTDSAASTHDTPFTWNQTRFADPLALQSNLWYRGRRYMVVRGTPTVPVTTRSPLYLEGRRGGFFVTMTAEGTAGWPARSVDGVSSHVVDFSNPSARKWYGGMLKYRRYVGSTNHTFVALQHSTPTVLASDAMQAADAEAGTLQCRRPGVRAAQDGDVLPMDVGHYGGVLHRHVHQLLPVQFARAAHDGLLRRTRFHRRALAFTESFYAGTQQYAVVRVDTLPRCPAEAGSAGVLREAWRQLASAVRQCAQLGVLGLPFTGVNLADGLASWAASSDAAAEVEQVLLRWYQAGAFMAAMFTEEPASAPGSMEVVGGPSLAALARPWWARLPLREATRRAIHANVHVRYALLPYLYTAAHDTSERGATFLAPIEFAQGTAASAGAATAASGCYSVGAALIVCPVTRPPAEVPPGGGGGAGAPAAAAAGGVSGVPHVVTAGGGADGGYFDLWTGAWYGNGGARPSPVDGSSGLAEWWARATEDPMRRGASDKSNTSNAAAAAALSWLTVAPYRASPQPLPIPAVTALAPTLLRRGHILATQNVITSPDGGEVDLRAVHSTHMGANWTITVALPPLPAPSAAGAAAPLKTVLLAEGTVFWDEGSHNSQHRPPTLRPGAPLPPDTPFIPAMVHHCALSLRCMYDGGGGTTPRPRLIVEVAQVSDSCAEALAELESHWREEPQGFAERLSLAQSRRNARVHEEEVRQDALEDKGVRGGPAAKGATAPPLSAADLRGLQLPNAAEEEARNSIAASHLLHRLRFLFQHGDDAARLVASRTAAAAATTTSTAEVVVQRRSRDSAGSSELRILGDADGAAAAGTARVVRGAVGAPNAVLVELDSVTQGAASPVSVFGARTIARGEGPAVPYVPPRHTWQFQFELA